MNRKKNKGKKHKPASVRKKLQKRNIKSPSATDSEVAKAIRYHQSGQLQKAEEIYKKILRINPGKLQAIRQKLAKNLTTEPLFDTPRFARNLEKAYKEMWEIFMAGESPRQIEVVES